MPSLRKEGGNGRGGGLDGPLRTYSANSRDFGERGNSGIHLVLDTCIHPGGGGLDDPIRRYAGMDSAIDVREGI